MEIWEKKIYIEPGHVNKLIQRGIGGNIYSIKRHMCKMLKTGVRIKNPEAEKPADKLCICEWRNRYFTIPYIEGEGWVIIFSAIPSKSWEIEEFKKIKREI